MENNAKSSAVKNSTAMERIIESFIAMLILAKETEDRTYHLNRKMSGDLSPDDSNDKMGNPDELPYIERVNWYLSEITQSQNRTIGFVNRLEEAI